MAEDVADFFAVAAIDDLANAAPPGHLLKNDAP